MTVLYDPTHPACELCLSNAGDTTPATHVAAQSSDQGQTVHWLVICDTHRDGWNDGGDWDAPVFAIGAPVAA